MKKAWIFLLPALLFISACGSGSGDDKPAETASGEVPAGMIPYDLTTHGLQVVINVLDSVSSKVKILVEPQPTGAITIKAGGQFQLSVQEADGELIDMALQKNFIQSDDVNKFQKFIVDEPLAIFYESKITTPEYHFYVIRKIGNSNYVIRDNPEEKFSKDAVQRMFDAAKSLRGKEGAKAS